MNTELFIAQRTVKGSKSDKKFSKPIISIAIIGIGLGLAVMILSVSIVTGFKKEIRNKIIGFGSHIQIVNFDSNTSYETLPVEKNQSFYPYKNDIPDVKHIQVFATKAGIIKTDNDIQGIVLKGVGQDFDWSFFNKTLVEGKNFTVTDSAKSNDIIISESLAGLLKLKLGDKIETYFIQDPPRMRKFTICGIYKTSLEEFDKLFALVDIGHIQKLNGWNTDQVSGFEVIIDNYNKIDEVDETLYYMVSNQMTKNGTMLKTITIKDKFPQIFDWLELQDLNVWVILILLTVVAGFNMVSGLLILILERTSMIGILKALGSHNWFIRRIFLFKAAYLIGKGLLWGNFIGISLCLLQQYTGFFKLNPETYYVDVVPINLSFYYILLLNLSTLFVTIVMLVIPSYIISKISPVKAILFD